MNILILGGAGFLGNNLVRRCLKEGHKITVVDSLDYRLKSKKENLNEVIDAIEFIQGDICDKNLMKRVIKNKEVIFNCAAQTSHTLSFKDPYFDIQVNCIGNIILLESIRRYNKDALVIYPSSSTVIGRARSRIITEDHIERPLDIYSADKGVAEKYYYIYHNVYGLNTIILRFANLYGPYGKGYPDFGFINYFISLAFKDEEITIYGDGSQLRNVMYVEDAVEILYRSIFHKELIGNIYFAVHKEHYSIREIAEEIVSVFGRGKIKMVDWPEIREKIEVNNAIISGKNLFNKLRYEPKYSLKEGLLKTKEIMERG